MKYRPNNDNKTTCFLPWFVYRLRLQISAAEICMRANVCREWMDTYARIYMCLSIYIIKEIFFPMSVRNITQHQLPDNVRFICERGR